MNITSLEFSQNLVDLQKEGHIGYKDLQLEILKRWSQIPGRANELKDENGNLIFCTLDEAKSSHVGWQSAISLETFVPGETDGIGGAPYVVPKNFSQTTKEVTLFNQKSLKVSTLDSIVSFQIYNAPVKAYHIIEYYSVDNSAGSSMIFGTGLTFFAIPDNSLSGKWKIISFERTTGIETDPLVNDPVVYEMAAIGASDKNIFSVAWGMNSTADDTEYSYIGSFELSNPHEPAYPLYSIFGGPFKLSINDYNSLANLNSSQSYKLNHWFGGHDPERYYALITYNGDHKYSVQIGDSRRNGTTGEINYLTKDFNVDFSILYESFTRSDEKEPVSPPSPEPPPVVITPQPETGSIAMFRFYVVASEDETTGITEPIVIRGEISGDRSFQIPLGDNSPVINGHMMGVELNDGTIERRWTHIDPIQYFLMPEYTGQFAFNGFYRPANPLVDTPSESIGMTIFETITSSGDYWINLTDSYRRNLSSSIDVIPNMDEINEIYDSENTDSENNEQDDSENTDSENTDLENNLEENQTEYSSQHSTWEYIKSSDDLREIPRDTYTVFHKQESNCSTFKDHSISIRLNLPLGNQLECERIFTGDNVSDISLHSNGCSFVVSKTYTELTTPNNIIGEELKPSISTSTILFAVKNGEKILREIEIIVDLTCVSKTEIHVRID